MTEYMIEFTHPEDQCAHVLAEAQESGQLPEIYRGCTAGRHTDWAVVRAGDPDEARDMVPAPLRDSVKITEVQRFSAGKPQARKETAA